MAKKYLRTDIGPEWDGRELLEYLKRELHFSAAKIASVKYDPEGLLVDGDRVTVRHRLAQGEELAVLMTDSEKRPEKLIPNPLPLEILYEDDWITAVNKPAGMVCHPSAGHASDSLANALRAHFDATDPEARVHLVGRLDKETSGIVVCAKNGTAAERMMQRDGNSFEKEYTAFASGLIAEDSGIIALPVREVRDEETRIVRLEAGEKPAVTHFTVTARKEAGFGEYTVLKVTIDTGRMHQIRAHFAAAGHPLLADTFYGGPVVPGLSRTALHAGRVTLRHPLSGEEICLSAPLPADLAALI